MTIYTCHTIVRFLPLNTLPHLQRMSSPSGNWLRSGNHGRIMNFHPYGYLHHPGNLNLRSFDRVVFLFGTASLFFFYYHLYIHLWVMLP